jgi:hypothetical protein
MTWEKQDGKSGFKQEAKPEEEKYWLSRVPAIRCLQTVREQDLRSPELIPPPIEDKVLLMRIQGAIMFPTLGECQVDLRVAATQIKNDC